MNPRFYIITTLFILFSLLTFEINAQTLPCGTTPSRDYLDNFAQIGVNGQRSNPIPRLNRKLSITSWIMRDSLGEAAHTEASIEAAIDGLNTLFEPIATTFAVCDHRYVDNYNFHDFVSQEEQPELVNTYYEPNTINMYFSNTVVVGVDTVGGYASMPGGPDVIFISQLGSIPHEMGHFFGLFHTFETGDELADGSNCETAGDFVCDTEADPYYTNIPMDSINTCNIEENLVDANGQFYVPPTNNIMSYYEGCQCIFTNGQYARMVEQFLAARAYLW